MVEGAFWEKISPAFAGTTLELPRIHEEGADDVAVSASASAMENFDNTLALSTLVVAVAACRGVTFSEHIARFLVRLACGLSAEILEKILP